MGNGPSMFVRTPQEHLENMWKHPSPLPFSSPPGHVRVYLLSEWTPGKSPLNDPWAALKADFPVKLCTGELELKRVKCKWGLERCSAIDLERMQPFEEKYKGRLSRLALNVLADEKGVVWMYEPTPSELTISIRADRLRLVRQFDAAIERIIEATLGRISELLDDGVRGQSVSHYYPQYSDGGDPGPPNLSQEGPHNEPERQPVLIPDGEHDAISGIYRWQLEWERQRRLVFFVALLFLFMSGALGRYVKFGREFAFGW